MTRKQRPKARPTSLAALSRITVNPKLRYRCPTGKLRYRDKREARWALHSMMVLREAGQKSRRERNYYMCPECKGWHLTSQLTTDQKDDLRARNARAMRAVWQAEHLRRPILEHCG